MQQVWDAYWTPAETADISCLRTQHPIYRLLKRLLKPSEVHGKVLDVGCGSGFLTLTLLKEFDGLAPNGVLLDYSRVALMLARKNAFENHIMVQFVLADALNMPFLDRTFELVYNAGVCEHFYGDGRTRIFLEMARVCNEKGHMIVIVPNTLSLPYRIWKKLLELQGRWGYGLERPFSIFELRNRIRSARLVPNKEKGGVILGSFQKLLTLQMPGNDSSTHSGQRMTTIERLLRGIELNIESLLGLFGEYIGIEATRMDSI